MAELYSTYLEYHLVYLLYSSQLLKHWLAMVVLPELESKGPCYHCYVSMITLWISRLNIQNPRIGS